MWFVTETTGSNLLAQIWLKNGKKKILQQVGSKAQGTSTLP